MNQNNAIGGPEGLSRWLERFAQFPRWRVGLVIARPL